MNYNNILFYQNFKELDDGELKNILKGSDCYFLAKHYNLGVERLETLKKLESILPMSFESFLTEHIINVKLEEDVITYALKHLGIDSLLGAVEGGVNFGTYSNNFIQKLKLLNKLMK